MVLGIVWGKGQPSTQVLKFLIYSKMNMRSASQLLDSLIKESFPEFISPVGRSFTLSRRTARWKRLRMDALYECLAVQFSIFSESQIAINIDCVVHYFEECPIPPGVFGISFNVMDRLTDNVLDAVFKYVGGLNWLEFDSAHAPAQVAECLSVLSASVRQNFEDAATQIANDAFRRNTYEYCMSLDRSSAISYEQIHEALSKYGAPHPIRGLNYSVGKAAHQLHAWLSGEKNWTQF